MSLEKLIKDPYAILASSAVVGISIYFAVEFIDFINRGPLKGYEEVRKKRIKDICERNCMLISYNNGVSEKAVGSGMLIRTKRDFSKKSGNSFGELPETEEDKAEKEQQKKDVALLLTNYHVINQLNKNIDNGKDLRTNVENHILVEPMTSGLFEEDGKSFRKDGDKKELIYYDWKCDLALLRVNFYDIGGILSNRKSLELAESNPDQLEKVYVTGFPEGVPTVKDPAAVTAICYRKINKEADNLNAVDRNQEDESCIRCLKIDTQVECGASGGPVMNSEKQIVGVTASKAGKDGDTENVPPAVDGCLAISVEQIHKFLEDAENSYKKAQKFGKHGIKMKINNTEVDGEETAAEFFTVTGYNDAIEIFRSKFEVASDPDRKNRISKIVIKPGMLIDGKEVTNFTTKTPGVDLVVQQISDGTGQFQIHEMYYTNKEDKYDNPYFSVN